MLPHQVWKGQQITAGDEKGRWKIGNPRQHSANFLGSSRESWFVPHSCLVGPVEVSHVYTHIHKSWVQPPQAEQ